MRAIQGGLRAALFVSLETPRRMRMDCERARPGESNERPAAFDPQQTQTFER